MIRLRAHHLLCTVLYQGKGYREGFVANMNEVVGALHNPDEQVRIVTQPDIICRECPNANSDGICALDKKIEPHPPADKTIKSLDEKVIDFFNLEVNKEYRVGEVFSIVKAGISPEFFNATCSECRWHKMGLCEYQEYLKRLDIFVSED